MSDHSTRTRVHRAHAWEYADAAARTGATGFVAADVYKLALQTDDKSIWLLTATTPTWVQVGGALLKTVIMLTVGDETTALAAGTGKLTFRMPHAMTLTAVRASLTVAQGSGSIFTVDINEAGTTILSTNLTVDNTEKTSTTAAAPAVISDASLADDAEITIDIDQVGDGTAKGLKIYLIGTRS